MADAFAADYCGGLGVPLQRKEVPVYEASATLLVQQRRANLSPGISDYRLSEQLASTFSRQVTASPFLERVLENHDLSLSVLILRNMISVRIDNDPPLLEIKARDSNAESAAIIADFLAGDFVDYVIEQRLAEIGRLQAAATAQGLANIEDLVAPQFAVIDSLSLLEPVDVPLRPILPRTRRNILLGILLGVTLATSGALLTASLRDTVGNPDELPRRYGVTALGAIFKWSSHDHSKQEPILWAQPSSAYAEAFRQIRANIHFATAKEPGWVFLVTSPGPEEGKSTIISNLAVAFAQIGQLVAVVDGDLRRPSMHRLFQVANPHPGLINFLADTDMELGSILQSTDSEGVSLVVAGPTPPNPSELLGTPRMGVLLEQLKEVADIVLVDSPPLLLVADPSVVATQVDGAILVVDGSTTRPSSLRAALGTLANTRVNVVGVILNKLKHTRFGYGYEYPYYYRQSRYPQKVCNRSGGVPSL